MEDVMNIASYFYHQYNSIYGVKIDEMKLHKLMYFAQRESLIQIEQPLFDAVFYGWRYGPILKEIRSAYRDSNFKMIDEQQLNQTTRKVLNRVFSDYAAKDSWSLSILTHGELCWKNSRKGVSELENSDNAIRIEDMKIDAKRIKERREMLSQIGLL